MAIRSNNFEQKYEVLEEISGSGAIIYKAKDKSYDRLVSIKTPDSLTVKNPERLSQFVNEGRLLAQFDHANIVTAYHFHEIGELDDRCYIVSPWMDATLDVILENENLSEIAAADILMKIFEGIRALHQKDIIHCDIKPSNIFLSKDRTQVKIGDLGIASNLSADQTLNSSDFTPKYHAPEILDEGAKVGRRTDIYSLGFMSLEMFLGKEKFEQAFSEIYLAEYGNVNRRWHNWHQDDSRLAPTLSQADPEIGDELSSIVATMTAKRPGDRQPDIDTVIGEFKNYFSGGASSLPYSTLDNTGEFLGPEKVSFFKTKTFAFGLPVVLIVWAVLIFLFLSHKSPEHKSAIEVMNRMESVRAIDISLGLGEEGISKEFDLAEPVRDQANSLFAEKKFSIAQEKYEQGFTLYLGAFNALFESYREKISELKSLAAEHQATEYESYLSGLTKEALALEGRELKKYVPAQAHYMEAVAAMQTAVANGRAVFLQIKAKAMVKELTALGSDDTEPDFLRGNDLEVSASKSLSESEFSQSILLFEESISILSDLLEENKRPIKVLLGSSQKEIDGAMDLCAEHMSECDRGWYASETQREKTIHPFKLDLTEVTNQEFYLFVQSTGYKTTAEKNAFSWKVIAGKSARAELLSWRSNVDADGFQSKPVKSVSLEDAQSFCNYKGKRLPTADEWELIARGGRKNTTYPWGNEWLEDRAVWGVDDVALVGSVEEGRAPSGHLDMVGNVWEWTSTNTGSGYVLKGGSWAERNPANLRPAAAIVAAAEDASDDFGFRCATPSEIWQ
jgi:serine/threonine protein kinase